MGGAVVVNVAQSRKIKTLLGTVVVDVVEGRYIKFINTRNRSRISVSYELLSFKKTF
jgi:hypothetical protein